MQSGSTRKKSTETLYEIKAPLASFDTIDLDDDEQFYSSSLNQAITPEKGQRETSEATWTHSPVKTPENETPENCIEKEQVSVAVSQEINASVTEQEDAVTPTAAPEDFPDSFIAAEARETGNSPTSTVSKDANSSENNASAEDIQNELKIKGRKYKEKASNVKYEQIENSSDVSDQEKTESISPLPTLKLKPSSKTQYDSDSESSDSDSGYIRRGYLSATRGAKFDEPDASPRRVARAVHKARDSYDSDSTPHSSPKVTRPTLPPPLSKEESAIASKRKAYEKRLQRLQVTTTPIERPRSTTPIDIHGLEEYASISSPERSPGGSNLEKLKIRLPREDSFKGKSPRRSSKSTNEPSSSPVFSFSEDLLFTHTRSAIIMEEGLPGQSPKRVLVPPTLSPKLSPACSPQIRKVSAPKYFFTPETARNGTSIETETNAPPSTSADNNWATFEDMAIKQVENVDSDVNKLDKNRVEEKVGDDVNTSSGDCITARSVNSIEDKGGLVVEPGSPVKKHVPHGMDVHSCEELSRDEVLTVQIEESGDTRMCDIKYEEAVDLK